MSQLKQYQVQLLSLRLQVQLEPYGIKLDMQKFEDMLREDNSESTGRCVRFAL